MSAQVIHKSAALLATLALWGRVATQGAEHVPLADVEQRITIIARDSGGSATTSKLQNAGGNDIQTAGANPQKITLLKIAKAGGVGDPVKVLVTGAHHAREWVSYRIVLDAGDFIVTNGPTDTWPAGPQFNYFRKFKEMNVKALTDNAVIFMVPIVNSEGYEFSGTAGNDSWRKNRRDVTNDPAPPAEGPPGGNPLIGIDLNRNYPSSDWGKVSYAMALTAGPTIPAGRGGSVTTPVPGI